MIWKGRSYRTVFILGAGATRGAVRHVLVNHKRLKAPLNRDFFDVAKTFVRAYSDKPAIKERLDRVRKVFEEEFPTRGRWPLPMETAFSLLYVSKDFPEIYGRKGGRKRRPGGREEIDDFLTLTFGILTSIESRASHDNLDTENNLLSIEDANTHTTSFAYDPYGRVTQTTFPSNFYETYAYDAANNLTSKTDRNGKTIGYVYDDLNRLTQKNYPDSTNVEYVYDLVGKLQQVTDPTGNYGFAYDNLGRLVGSTTQYTFLPSSNYSMSYTYDADSNRVSMTDPQSGVTSYVYDTLNRLSTLTPPPAFGSGSFGFTYDALSRRTQMTRPNGVTTNYTYDNLSRLLSVLHQKGASTIDGATYTVDPAGNRLTKANGLSGVTSTYTYDPLYELTQVTQSTATTESYTYDPVGNRLSSLGLSPYTQNTSNEVTAVPGTTYTYDSNGNTLTKVTSAGTTTYIWDYENRLTSVTLPSTGGTLTFKYNGLGQRVEKTFTQGSNTAVTNYLYDRESAIADVDQNGNILARYISTLNLDEPLEQLRSATTSYFAQDGLGSITSLITSAGALGNTYTYDSFGKLTSSGGSIANRFQFTSREFDSESGIYFYRNRYYDSIAGRFLSEDPKHFRAGINFYSYVSNNSVNFSDPRGTFPEVGCACKTIAGALAGGIAGAGIGRGVGTVLGGLGGGVLGGLAGFGGGETLEPVGGGIPGGVAGGVAGAGEGAADGAAVGTVVGAGVGALVGGAWAYLHCDKGGDCDLQYKNDSSVCRLLPDSDDRRRCWQSAISRYAQCLRGQTPKPLDW